MCYPIPETFECSFMAFIGILRFSEVASIKGSNMIFVAIHNEHIYKIKSTSTYKKKGRAWVYISQSHDSGLLKITKII